MRLRNLVGVIILFIFGVDVNLLSGSLTRVALLNIESQEFFHLEFHITLIGMYKYSALEKIIRGASRCNYVFGFIAVYFIEQIWGWKAFRNRALRRRGVSDIFAAIS